MTVSVSTPPTHIHHIHPHTHSTLPLALIAPAPSLTHTRTLAHTLQSRRAEASIKLTPPPHTHTHARTHARTHAWKILVDLKRGGDSKKKNTNANLASIFLVPHTNTLSRPSRLFSLFLSLSLENEVLHVCPCFRTRCVPRPGPG